MSTGKVQMRYDDDRPAGEAERIALPKGVRIRRGFKEGAIFWILAPFFLPLPLLHFIIIPLLLAIGTVKAWAFWTSPGILKNGASKCPRCEHPLLIDEVPDQWPLKLLCEKCGFQVRLYEGG